MIDGVPLEEPASIDVETADGTTTVWRQPSTVPSGPRTPRLDRAAAVDAVTRRHGFTTESAHLAWARTQAGLRLSWIVEAPLDLHTMRKPVYRVDATTGRVVQWVDRVVAASAPAFPENPETTPDVELHTLTGLLEPGDALTHSRFEVHSCLESSGDDCSLVRYAAPDASGDFVGFEPQTGFVTDDAFAETSAYVHAERFLDHMASFGVTENWCGWAMDTRPVLITNFVSADGGPVQNGYFMGACPSSILFGQGPADDWAYDGDVVYHELGHAMVDLLTPSYFGAGHARPDAWVYDSNAINEAIADVFTAQFTGDGLIAESLFARDIDSDAQCPGDLDGEPHNDSLPVSAALWSLSLAWGDDFVPVLLDTIATLPPDTSYEGFAESFAVVAGASLGTDAEASARAAFEAHGVTACERVVPLGLGEERRVLLLARLSLQPFTPAPLQVAIDVPEGTALAEVDYRLLDIGFFEGPVHVAWRWDAPVAFEYGGEDGTQVEATVDGGDTELPEQGTLEFEPPSSATAHRLYLSFANVQDGRHWVTIDGLQLTPAVVEDPSGSSSEGGTSGDASSGGSSGEVPGGTEGGSSDTDAAPAASASGGGCRVGGGPRWWLLVLGLFARRRVTPGRAGARATRG